MNLLVNPNFDEGHHHQDNIPEVVVPDGWYLHWIDGEKFPGSESIAYRPESVVWNINDAPKNEKTLFFLNGTYCWKVFKANAPLYFAITQEVKGLTPGVKYRFSTMVFPDIVEKYRDGKKVNPGDIWSAESRVGWSAAETPWPHAQDGAVHWAAWFNIHNQNYKFGAYNQVWLEFEAPERGEVRVWLECKAKWGFENNWFMDAFVLEPATDGGEAPGPVLTPIPELVSTVRRGGPRQSYARTYFLLPKDLSDEMLLAVLRVAHDLDASVGFSPDDAGIGDLDSRRVVAVAPERIGTGINQAWYDLYYPGVKFVAIEFAVNAAALELQLRTAALG